MKNAILERALIQRCRRGVTPSRVITAPEPGARVLSMLSEADRLATFQLSMERIRTAVGPLPNRPVPRDRALVAVCGTACGDDDSPDVTSEHEPELPTEE